MSRRARHQRRWSSVSLVCSILGMGLFLATGFAHDFGDSYTLTAASAAGTLVMMAAALMSLIHASDI